MNCIVPEAFPARLPLADLMRHDARLIEAREGNLIVRQGDYGDSVFVLCTGRLLVVVDPEGELGYRHKQDSRKLSWLGAIAQLWRNSSFAEKRSIADPISETGSLTKDGGDSRISLDDRKEFIGRGLPADIQAGEMVGEIAALRRSARTATLVAAEDCQLVEIRWQGIRDLMRFTPDLKHRIEELFRSRGRAHLIEQSPIFSDVPEKLLTAAVKASRFEIHGNEAWNKGLRKWMGDDEGTVSAREETVIEAGDLLDGVRVIVSGFAARITIAAGPAQQTLGYTRPGDLFGLDEIIDSAANGTPALARTSLRAIGTLDLMVIPTDNFLTQIAPYLDEKKLDEQRISRTWSGNLSQGMLDFLVDQRTINGTSAMLIDLDRCTGCDDCVKACAVTHDNNPRFLRRGYRHAHLLVANACMHCVDPVCLVGCPTGAIHRTRTTGVVVIDDLTCIGCGVCVEACPYDSIRTVEIRDQGGNLVVDAKTGAPIVKATKCDLCLGQPAGPACQNACPHDALNRIDFGNPRSLVDWISG